MKELKIYKYEHMTCVLKIVNNGDGLLLHHAPFADSDNLIINKTINNSGSG